MNSDYHAGNYGGIEKGAARVFIDYISALLNEIDTCVNTSKRNCGGFGNAVSLTYINAGNEVRSLIPKQINAKIDIRFIDNEFLKQVELILEKYCKKYGLLYDVKQKEEGYYNEGNEIFITRLCSIIQQVTDKEAKVLDYCGAYLPMKKLKDIKGVKYVLPLANSDECNHAPNENISMIHLENGIQIIKKLICKG